MALSPGFMKDKIDENRAKNRRCLDTTARAQTLLDWYETRTKVTEEEGADWYEYWYRRIASMTDRHPTIEPDALVAAVALMSANTTWEALVDAVPQWLEDSNSKVPAYPALVDKADLVLAGWDWHELVPFETSPKLHTFAHALLGDRDAVVVDTWMVRAMNISPGGHFKVKTPQLRAKAYREHQDAIVKAAAETRYKPRDFQAVVWCTIRSWS